MQPEKVDAGWAKRPVSVQTPASPVRSSTESGPRQRTPKKNERKSKMIDPEKKELVIETFKMQCFPGIVISIGIYYYP